MKKQLVILIMMLMSIGGFAQHGEWTWMNGDSAVNSPGHYGTQGVFDPLNSPPSNICAGAWTDLQGNFWLFGGISGYANLMEFKPSINQWAWIKGSNTISGIYGTQGLASRSNNPGMRQGFPTWVDISGNLWLFGGKGFDINGNDGTLNDLWKYDISANMWTWMKGPDLYNNPGSYGIIGVEDSTNIPPSRYGTTASWTDDNNNLWLFGGSNQTWQDFNDLWKYNITTNNWTWMKGANTTNSGGIWGTKGVPNPSNTPNGRMAWAKWKDINGNLWLFGGSHNFVGDKNDLWKYTIATNEWTWMSGTFRTDDTGLVSGPCISSINNLPPCREKNPVCWTMGGGNHFETFGGYWPYNLYTLNDIWDYNVTTNEWTLITDSVYFDSPGNYGTLGVSSPTNMIMTRAESVGWKDINGNLWVFGGGNHNSDRLNDMWRYVPDTNCFYSGIHESIPAKTKITVYPNPASNTITIHQDNYFPNQQVIITDILGHEVYKAPLTGIDNTIYLTKWSNGVYFYEVRSEKESVRGKFIKQ
ncbi:MAG: kelch repeat-containing protein [Bacteroidota bacterium]